MAVNYASTLKSSRMAAVINAIDAGAAAGTLEICTAAYAAVLVAIPLADPSFTENAGVITLSGTPRSAVATAEGTAAIARIKDSDGNIMVSGLTVGVGSGEIQLNSVDIEIDQTVSLTSGTITHSA